MEDRIRKSYEKINISEDAKKKIEMEILEENSIENKRRNNRNTFQARGLKVAIAIGILLIVTVPTGVYAAQKIYNYFASSSKNGNFSIDMEMGKNNDIDEQQKYIKLVTDFGDDYTLMKGSDQPRTYTNGASSILVYQSNNEAESGKDFWYQLVYLDVEEDVVVSNYDLAQNEELNINGRKALYAKSNDVLGSKYTEGDDLSYGQMMYIFFEEYGYLLKMAAQNGLSKSDFVDLAEHIFVEEVEQENEASNYILISEDVEVPSWEEGQVTDYGFEVIENSNYFNKQATFTTKEYDEENNEIFYTDTTYTVKEVKILDSISELDESAFIDGDFDYRDVVDEEGNLLKYDREKLEVGDGVDTPNRKVVATESIQPKLVYVTLEVDGFDKRKWPEQIEVPSLDFVVNENGVMKHYMNNMYDEVYVRPNNIRNAFIDNKPCYFEESLGGKLGWKADVQGEKSILHFAYLVDEDYVDGLALWFSNVYTDKDCEQYIGLSSKG